jgi:DNA replication protein DnaC
MLSSKGAVSDPPGAIDRTCRCGNGSGWISTGKNCVIICPCLLQKTKKFIVGREFNPVTLDTIVARENQKNALQALRNNRDGSFLLFGGYGRGKTHLLAGLFDWHWFQYSGLCHWFNAVTLSNLSRDFDDPMFDELIKRFECSPNRHRVFIDDLGRDPLSPWLRRQLYLLTDTIKRYGHSIAITTNYQLDALADDDDPKMPGGAIMRRIDDMVTKIKL